MSTSPIRLVAFLAYFLIFQVACQPQADFVWQEGDILFQDGDCGDFCDAIRAVTSGYDGRDFSHNGFLMQENNKWYVLEAISKGVSKTPIDSFLNRHVDSSQKPKVMVGRLKPEFRHLLSPALLQAKKLLGRPYDSGFDLLNDSYYCSELIHLSLQKANHGQPVFEIQPMTFKDPDSKKFFSVWEVYFDKLGMEIPEGKPGLNPGGMSLDPAIEMIYDFQQ
ncbi:YiiX/YebB-like N1pC/P60 family cysteine hydrolase [Algoriphagus resistens]|uniref:YiiX/YebB-like N1pC/P60 family cysteine hydrolase n=1 Tax=Algoriphagus resistens TaxID=1750590 RepID=UPI00071694D5|nr:YiiX/YebB-like N1pC/P60 family cysteine hydrolase [Algoriphagus resistens]